MGCGLSAPDYRRAAALLIRPGLRRIAHQIADFVYEEFTGDSAYFDTQIVYVSESGPASRRVKRLAIMDQDGHNHRFLTSGLDLVLTSRFSPTAHEIAYLNYFNDEPNVYLLDVASGRTERLGSFPGMTFAPRFGPDGNKLIMSSLKTGRQISLRWICARKASPS